MFFTRMKEIREEAGLKQKDVAKMLGVSKGSYSMWECGADIIPLKRLNQFANYFHVDLDYVIGISNNKLKNNITPDIKIMITGYNLKKIREDKKMTQSEMAKSLKINQPSWNRYENSKNLILTSVIIDLARKYHQSIDDILGKNKSKDKPDN